MMCPNEFNIDPIIDSKNVCNDLINRLQSQVGGLLPPPYPPNVNMGESPKGPEEKVSSIELSLKDLQASVAKLMSKIKDPDEDEKILSENITKELQDIVDTFNKNFEEWSSRTGCVVNFSWGYQPVKKLEITGIDYIVFRREAPSAKTLKEVLEKAPKDTADTPVK